MDWQQLDIRLDGLKQHYQAGDFTPLQLCEYLLGENKQLNEVNPVWTYLLSMDELEAYVKALGDVPDESRPLWGVPFAIKDNIDLAGVPTTAACPAYSYEPTTSATVVQRLIDAGAIPLGKTNMDQFATGLVGTRSPEPWGTVGNAFDRNMTSGGSSAGSAVAVALGFASFSLGTDTAGSGRVPAAYNNLVGVKPTRGILSTQGVVPACRSLDCVSIFALTTGDAAEVLGCCIAHDEKDAYSRKMHSISAYGQWSGPFVFGVPMTGQLAFFGDASYEKLFYQTVDALESLGGIKKVVDIDALLSAARLLYEGPWVAERDIAFGNFASENPDKVLPVIKDILATARDKTARDVFSAQYQMQEYYQQAKEIYQSIDFLLTPTVGTHYSIDAINHDPIGLNSQLGYYTNYMNLLDLSALALPTAFCENGLPFGVTLSSLPFRDFELLSLGKLFSDHLLLSPGKTELPYYKKNEPAAQTNTIDVVVCGAHLEGFPLNWQLSERHAWLIEKTHSAKAYRFYALAGGPPFRPAMIRDDINGAAIEVEVWRMPAEHFGSFVAGIPSPLGIGKVQLADGRWESGFICDGSGMEGAEDITLYGSWKQYMSRVHHK